MVSIIVPAYNVKSYIKQCINSILSQTYSDFELILIDDGSTDQSGIICDLFDDSRIRVFHTLNHGLGAARNLGIKNARGDFIFFVDSDDWIDSNLLSDAISQIGNADILCFGYDTYPIQTSLRSGFEALNTLIDGDISETAWSRLYRRECFSSILFPESILFEDIAISYKLFLQANYVRCDNISGYHYRNRSDSLSHYHDKANIIDYWVVHKNRFIECCDIVDKAHKRKLLEYCALAISRAWAWRNIIPELKNETKLFSEMSLFAKEHFPLSVYLPLRLRIGIFLAKHPNKLSYIIANKALLINYRLKKMYKLG